MTPKLYPTIGLEIHVELKTLSKMFCTCPAVHFQVKPNTHTCPVCLGLPGALPVPNQKAIDWAIMVGLALDCQINLETTFDRKHYFYPDLPKGYQISQLDDPFCFSGKLELDSGKIVRINRVHLEEDTAKLIHKKVNNQPVTLIDFNRSGVPLVEIVTEPDLHHAADAKEFLKKLQAIVRSLNVSNCDMEKGSMRLEANISLSPDPNQLADYKVEVKNLNSFRFVEQAINYEISRQSEFLKSKKKPVQETRGYNPKLKQTFTQRIKETAEDYRYFPEPDIPPIILTPEYIKALRSKLPQLPASRIKALIDQYHLSANTAKIIVADPKKLQYFKANLKNLEPIKLANLIVNKKIDISKPLNTQLRAGLTAKIDLNLLDQVITENSEVVAKYKAGKTSVLGFLVGQVMKLTHGQADPKQTQKILLDKLNLKS
ncbi:MAG: Asp-tRNA(Asn)/Glu-tRNA(Gln) amidotransferase subunit GatB [Candidatus Beckwithbacteria bacterium]